MAAAAHALSAGRSRSALLRSRGDINRDNPFKPAGVFYFEIAEPQIDVTEVPEKDYPKGLRRNGKSASSWTALCSTIKASSRA
jgi:hypothetical protein